MYWIRMDRQIRMHLSLKFWIFRLCDFILNQENFLDLSSSPSNFGFFDQMFCYFILNQSTFLSSFKFTLNFELVKVIKIQHFLYNIFKVYSKFIQRFSNFPRYVYKNVLVSYKFFFFFFYQQFLFGQFFTYQFNLTFYTLEWSRFLRIVKKIL